MVIFFAIGVVQFYVWRTIKALKVVLRRYLLKRKLDLKSPTAKPISRRNPPLPYRAIKYRIQFNAKVSPIVSNDDSYQNGLAFCPSVSTLRGDDISILCLLSAFLLK